MAALVPWLLLLVVALGGPLHKGTGPRATAPARSVSRSAPLGVAPAGGPAAAARATAIGGPTPEAAASAVGGPTAQATASAASAPHVEPATDAAADAASIEPATDAAPAAVAVERVSLGGGAFLLVPAGLAPEGGSYDLVVHFHGVAPSLERSLGASGLRAVLVDVNVGLASGPYAAVVREGAVNLDHVVAKVERTMARRSPAFASARVGRVALSAWSAGYGSVLRLLASPKAAERVDAVLLADAPHANLRDVPRRRVDGAGLAPLVAFARRAVRGDALLAITHSDIATPGYASTRETTDFLVQSLGRARRPAAAPGPGRMVRSSVAEEGGFSVTGYEGVDAPAHCDHLRHLDATLFPRLRRHWGAHVVARATPTPFVGSPN